jgi:hypothetical protein
MVALCLNGLDHPEKQPLDGLLTKPFVNGGNNPTRRRTTERTARSAICVAAAIR